MPLITGYKLYLEKNSTVAAYSLEHARNLALPYIHKRQAITIEICVTSQPSQLWAYDYDTRQWVLQR